MLLPVPPSHFALLLLFFKETLSVSPASQLLGGGSSVSHVSAPAHGRCSNTCFLSQCFLKIGRTSEFVRWGNGELRPFSVSLKEGGAGKGSVEEL